MSHLFDNQQAITPFWLRLNKIFAYPLTTDTLAVIAGFSVLSLLKFLPGFGFLIGFLIWLGSYKYAYEVLAYTAKGGTGSTSLVYMANTDDMAVKQLFLVLGMIGMVALVAVFVHPVIAILFGMIVLISFPAAIIALAMEQRVLPALNPVLWLDLIGRIGSPYFLAVLFLLLMLISSATLKTYVLSLLPPLLSQVIFFFVSFYFLVVMFHLMGYIVYQYHEILGVKLSYAHSLEKARTADEIVLDEVKATVQEGELPKAIALLEESFGAGGGTPALRDEYHKLLRLAGDKEKLIEHGRHYITLLLNSFDNLRRALQIADDCLDVDKTFQLREPEQVLPLAKLAEQFGKSQLVVKLTSGFGSQYPDHPDTPNNDFLAAKALVNVNQEQKALDILRGLLRRYPEHALVAEIQQQVTVLERVLG